MTAYELQRMRNCLLNNAHMRRLGLPVVSNLFANVDVPLEKEKDKNQQDSGSEYNGQDEDNNQAIQVMQA